jgi:molecular chaperone HtpG
MEFDGKTMKSIVKGELDIDAAEDEKDKKKQDKAKKDFEAITSQMKEVLADKVSEVRVTNRLTDSPACVVSEDQGVSMHLQRMMEQAGQKSPMMGMGGGKPIFEVNPEHNLVKQLKDQQDDKAFSEWTQLLFDQAMLAESGQLEDPSSFVKRMNDLLMK